MAKEEMTPQKGKYDFTKLNTLAVVSLASAISGIGAIAALITGHISLAQIKRSGQDGRPLAIVGLVLGYATIAFWLVSAVFWVAVVATNFGGLHMNGYWGDEAYRIKDWFKD